ncbi:sensor histidine kinase [Planotetraspora mira]|uniref:histidine kinase n=1 Tax=Planotetraspora mira TaxID=58121 RepID=A0A8J3TZ15_9ACTN|nr:HAMP domain-containing sensor histidine kinase [Planotetraspora mira]GII29805.1 two-component sensor histidine kinase [Planotetraspora mira]
MARNVPLRRSLLLRLVVTSVLIAGCSIAAAAWLAVQSTTRAFQQEQGRALTDDAYVYDVLVGYAATHPSWDGVGGVVEDLARRTGRQIILASQDRARVAASAGAPRTLPDKASVVIDPLETDPALQPGTTDRVDPRVVGPYRLTAEERRQQKVVAGKIRDCIRYEGYPAQISESPGGRFTVEVAGKAPDTTMTSGCGAQELTELTPTEQRAFNQLNGLANACLRRKGLPAVGLTGSFARQHSLIDARSDIPQVQACLDAARREQLDPYVAPAGLLFVLSPGGTEQTRFNLSPANVARITGVTALVLAVTVAVTALVAARLVRPLRALTAAAQHPDGTFGRVPVTGRDEIGVLAAALTGLTERRERADAQRKVMVSDIAHELRTPLTNIRSWLEAVEDGLATPASDPALAATLLREARQLQDIIDDLQDLAVADADGLTLHPERIRVADLLDHVVTAHGGSAESAGVTLATRTDGDPELVADPMRLRQAVGNLVSNAVRHTPEDGHVTVYGRASDGHVEIGVADTGNGIAAEHLPHVFDRFWRADRSRSRETGGSGLGLAIVRQIAEAHGGTVTVTSTLGEGSTFTLRLPMRRPPADAP